MKIVFNTSALMKGLNKMKSAATGVLFNAEENVVTMTCVSAMNDAVKYTFPADAAEVEATGKMLVDFKYIYEAARKLDSEEAKIFFSDGLCFISGGRAKYKLLTNQSDDFANVRFGFADEDSMSVPAETLAAIVKATKACASKKETRPILTGINFASTKLKLIATATDSYRLAQKKVDLEGPAFNITVPLSGITILEDVILKTAEPGDDVTFATNGKAALFATGDTVIRTPLLDGHYPDTTNLIPKTFISELKIAKDEFKESVERPIFLKTENIAVETMSMTKDEIEIKANAQEIGGSEEKFYGEYSGEELEIAYNAQYLLDALKALTGKETIIRFAGEMKPFIISDEDDSSVQLVLPVRTHY